MILPPRPGEPFPDIAAYISERMGGRLAHGEICLLVRTLCDDGRLVRVVSFAGRNPWWPRLVQSYLVVPLGEVPFELTTEWVAGPRCRYRRRPRVNETFVALADRAQLLVLGEETVSDDRPSIRGDNKPRLGRRCPPPFPVFPWPRARLKEGPFLFVLRDQDA